MAKYYVNATGSYLGAWDNHNAAGVEVAPIVPPPGGIEVPLPPTNGRQLWDGTKWLPFIASPSPLAQAIDTYLNDPVQTFVKLQPVLQELRKVS